MDQKTGALTLTRIPLIELKPAKYNPRVALESGTPEYESLRRSIVEFGLVDPLVVNAQRTIIGGHQRFRVLSDLGWKSVDCVVVDLPPEKERTLNVALNKIEGVWDTVKLDEILKELNDQGLAELTGFSTREVELITTHAAAILKQEGEIDPAEFGDDKFSHVCPRCGFRFL